MHVRGRRRRLARCRAVSRGAQCGDLALGSLTPLDASDDASDASDDDDGVWRSSGDAGDGCVMRVRGDAVVVV